MSSPVQPDPQAALNDAFARGMSCRPASVQRTWVGLTEKERLAIMRRPSGTERGLAVLIEAKLKEKNT